ncbi:hypothetical protein DMENIID0001_066620 [Sergentomyia squamirostris]
MKFLAAFAFIAVMATSQAYTVENRNLEPHLQDFLDLLPLDQILRVATDYLGSDKEVQEVFAYVQSKDFAQLYEKTFNLKEVKAVLNFLTAAGVDVYNYLNQLGGLLGLPQIHPVLRLTRGKGVEGLLNDILALLPKDKLVALFDDKYKNVPEFKDFVDKLKSKDFDAIVDKLHQSKDYNGALATLKEHHVDLVKFLKVVKEFFGWH